MTSSARHHITVHTSSRLCSCSFSAVTVSGVFLISQQQTPHVTSAHLTMRLASPELHLPWQLRGHNVCVS